jgi:hypothetical protein
MRLKKMRKVWFFFTVVFACLILVGLEAAASPYLSAPPHLLKEAQSKPNQILSQSSRSDRVFTAEVYAVFENVDPKLLFEVATDFGAYGEYRLPNLRGTQIIHQRSPSRLQTWNWMDGFGFESKHCYDIKIYSSLNFLAASGTEWSQTPCPASTWSQISGQFSRHIGPDNLDDSEFDWQRGTYFIQPLNESTVFVRYRFQGRISERFGFRLFRGQIQRTMESTAKEVVAIMTDIARRRSR